MDLNLIFEKSPNLNKILEHIEQVVWVQDLTTNQILYVSPAFEPVWGYACEELYANPKILINSIHPEDRVQVLAGKPNRASEITELTYRIRRSDGETLWVSSRSFLILDAEGKPDHLFSISQDISDQKQIEHSLRTTVEHSREQIRISHKLSLARNPGAVLKTLMSAQELRSAQRASLFLFDDPKTGPIHELNLTTSWQSRPSLSSWESEINLYDDPHFLALLHPRKTVIIPEIESEPRLSSQICEILQESMIHALTILPLYASGDWLGVLIVYFEQRKQLSQIEHLHLKVLINQVTITLHNLRLLAEEEKSRHLAERANDIKTEFLAMISHELRTPLTSIIGFTTTLLAEDVSWTQEDQHDFIMTIQQEADRLQDLIDHLLDLSRLEAGMLPIRLKPGSFSEIIDDAYPQLQTLTHNHKLIMQMPDKLPLVNVDTQRIAQVLVNLVKNAATFAAEGTEIEITSLVRGDYLHITVSDQGPGIPLKERKNIFKAFSRGLDSESSFPKGAGLGLAICKGLVEAHGGRIWIKNKKTPGTIISFTLPIVSEHILADGIFEEN